MYLIHKNGRVAPAYLTIKCPYPHQKKGKKVKKTKQNKTKEEALGLMVWNSGCLCHSSIMDEKSLVKKVPYKSEGWFIPASLQYTNLSKIH